jgi:murein tripeptide amidase MpaA
MSSFISQSPLTEISTLNHTKSIVFMARQHSGETPSSLVLEGVIEFLMDNTEFDIFKKNFQFVVIPFVNPDGVKYGNQRVNLAGADLNKCWKNPN